MKIMSSFGQRIWQRNEFMEEKEQGKKGLKSENEEPRLPTVSTVEQLLYICNSFNTEFYL